MRRAAAVLAAAICLAALRHAGANAAGIHGVIHEAPGHAPLAAVEVVVRSIADSTRIAHTTTDDAGRFRLADLAPGHYRLRASLLGHESLVRADLVLAEAATDLDLGALALAPAPLAVPGVSVSTARATAIVTADRTIYLTKDMPQATTGTATEVLRTVPELDVDIDGNVSLRGSPGVKIQFNGRSAPMKGEALVAYLRQLPANRIERIEVVANPSAKFDAEGAAGILNLVLKDGVKLGTSGNVNLSGGTRYSGPNASIGLQKGRLTLFGSGSGSWGSGSSSGESTRHNLLAPLASFYRSTSSSDYTSGYGSFDGSFDFAFDKRSTLYGTLDDSRNTTDTTPLSDEAVRDSSGADVSLARTTGDSKWTMNSHSATVGFAHVVQQGRNEWSAEFLESLSDRGSSRDGLRSASLPAGTADQVSRTGGSDGSHERSFQADDTHPLGAKGKLEMGYRGLERTNDVSSDLRYFVGGLPEVTPLAGSSDYAHREVFHSAYVTALSKFGPLSVQLGIRGEMAHTTFDVRTSGHRYVYDYRSVYPSGNAIWDFGKGRTLRLTYSRRVDRPSAYMLNPETPNPDSLNRSVGNPQLGPKYTHSVSLDATWSGNRGMLRLSPYFRETVDNWDRITEVDTHGISTATWRNASSIRYLGTSLTASLRQTKRLGGSVNVSVYREHHDAANLASQFRRDATGWSLNGNATFKTTAHLDLQGYAGYYPAQTLAQGRSSGVTFSSLGARYKFAERVSGGLSVSDPFDLYRYRMTSHDVTYDAAYSYRYNSRGVSASLSWSWGKPPEQQKRRQSADAPQQGAPGPSQ
jgi:hypothetical protein